MGAEKLIELVRDDVFAALWRKCCRTSIAWDEFQKLPMPAGMSPRDAYALVSALQHRAGTILPFGNYMPAVSGADNWFYETVEMHRLVRGIVSEVSAGSKLDRAISALSARTRLALRASDFAAACERDGFAIAVDEVRAVWSGARVATSPVELLAYNFAHAHDRVASLDGRRVSVGVLVMLWEALTEGLKMPEGTSRSYMVAEKKSSPLSSSDGALLAVSSLMDSGPQIEINAVVRSFLSGGIFWDFNPFPWANSITELLARSLIAHREGLPVLAYLPLSDAFLRWEQGRDAERGAFLEASPDIGEGYNSTTHFTRKLQITVDELRLLKERVSRIEFSEEAWRAALKADGRFNARQRDVLLSALHNPGARFFVADHERIHGVSHGTAYNDLVNLESLGLLKRQKTGRAYSFAATARLAKLVGATR